MASVGVNANDFALYAKAQNIYDTEPLYVVSVLDGHFDSPFFGGDSAISLDEQEIGFRYRRLSLAWVRKDHIWLSFQPQTAELLHTISNRIPLKVGTQYPIQLEAKQYTFQGIRTAYQIVSTPEFKLRLGGTYIRGENLLDGATHGTVSATAANEYDFSDIQLDYRYQKDDLFFNETPPPQGNGYAFDFQLQWKPDPRLELSLQASELFGRIYWRNAPYTLARIDSDTKTYDEEGYVKFNPTLRGNQGGRDFTQTLNSRVMTQAAVTVHQDATLLVDLLMTPIKSYPRIGLRHSYAERSSLDVLINPQQKTLHLSWANRWFSIGVSSDKLDVFKARAFAFTTAVSTAPMD